jgi:hypothetical protein
LLAIDKGESVRNRRFRIDLWLQRYFLESDGGSEWEEKHWLFLIGFYLRNGQELGSEANLTHEGRQRRLREKGLKEKLGTFKGPQRAGSGLLKEGRCFDTLQGHLDDCYLIILPKHYLPLFTTPPKVKLTEYPTPLPQLTHRQQRMGTQ